MAQKKSQENNPSTDVQLIRDILFGEQLEQYQQRIEALEESLSALQKDNEKLRKSLETESAFHKKAQKENAAQLTQLGDQLTDQIKAVEKLLTSQLSEESKTQKAILDKFDDNIRQELQISQSKSGDEIQSLEATLKAYQEHQESLIAAILAALTAYLRETPADTD